jgi:hypothetical protein
MTTYIITGTPSYNPNTGRFKGVIPIYKDITRKLLRPELKGRSKQYKKGIQKERAKLNKEIKFKFKKFQMVPKFYDKQDNPIFFVEGKLGMSIDKEKVK